MNYFNGIQKFFVPSIFFCTLGQNIFGFKKIFGFMNVICKDKKRDQPSSVPFISFIQLLTYCLSNIAAGSLSASSHKFF